MCDFIWHDRDWRTSKETRNLIRKTSRANLGRKPWIRGELVQLGIEIAQPTVAGSPTML